MATYDYTDDMGGGDVNKYNLLRDLETVGPGSTIGVNGQVTIKTAACKSILFVLYAGAKAFYVGYKNVNIKKGVATNYSYSFFVTAQMCQENSPTAVSRRIPLDLAMYFCPAAITAANDAMIKSWPHDADEYDENITYYFDYVNFSINQKPGQQNWYMWVKENTGPVLSANTGIYDLASVSALNAFGGLATGYSRPRLDGAWAFDSIYPEQLAHVTLTLTGALSGVYEADTASGATTSNFDLPSPTQAGTVNWTYTVADMFGMTATESGSFDVLSYFPPGIVDFTLERYADVIDEGGHAHVAADDGELVWLSLNAAVASVDGQNTWEATFTAWPEGMDEPNPVQGLAIVRGLDGNLTGLDDWDLNGIGAISLLRDEEQLTGFAPSAGANWIARITITDVLGNSATLISSDIVAADTILDVAPYGIGIGMRSKGQRNEFDPVTGDIAEIHQAVDIADDWMLRVRGPVAMNPGQLLKVVTIENAIPEQAVDSGNYVTVRTSFASMASTIGDGWVPISIAGWRGSSRYTMIHQCRIDRSTDELVTSAYNPSSSAKTFSVSVDLLCLRVVVEDEIAPTMDDVVIVAHTMILGDTVDSEVNGTTLEIDDGRFNVGGSTLNIV